MTSHRNRLATLWAVGALSLLACGTKSGRKDAAAGTGGGLASGGGLGTGGQTVIGGAPGVGGSSGSGGSPGTGGSMRDAGVPCTDDGGLGLPATARRCSQDSDCTIAIASRCCGPDLALGENPAQSATYAGCLALPPGACDGLGCAKYLGYMTDTGRVTAVTSASENPIDQVAVHCLQQLCTTDVIDAQDAGLDAPPVGVSVDAAPQACGDAGACGSGQACVLVGGGPVPPCSPPSDAGTCPSGEILVTSCSAYGGNTYRPGCTTPPPSPHCAPLADGCGDICSCVCPGNPGCYPGPGYTICSLP